MKQLHLPLLTASVVAVAAEAQKPHYINEARRNPPPGVSAPKNPPTSARSLRTYQQASKSSQRDPETQPSPTTEADPETVSKTETPPFTSNKSDPLDLQLRRWIEHNGGSVHPDLNVFTSDDPLHHHHFHQRQKRLKKEKKEREQKKLETDKLNQVDDSWPPEKERQFMASSPSDESADDYAGLDSELSDQDSISLYAHDGYVHSVAERVASSLSASGGGFVGPGSTLSNLRSAVQKWVGSEGTDGSGNGGSASGKGGSIFAGKRRAAYRGVDMRCTHDHEHDDGSAHADHEHEELLLRVPRKIAFSHKVCEQANAANAGDSDSNFPNNSDYFNTADDYEAESDSDYLSDIPKKKNETPFPLYNEFFSNYRGRSRTTNVEKTVICLTEYIGKMVESGWDLTKKEKTEWIKDQMNQQSQNGTIIKDSKVIGGIQSAGKGGAVPAPVGSSAGIGKQFGDDMKDARDRVLGGSALGVDSDGMDASSIVGVGSLGNASGKEESLKQTSAQNFPSKNARANDESNSELQEYTTIHDNLLFDLPAIEKSATSETNSNTQDYLNNFLPLFRSISTLGSTVDELPLLKLYDELCLEKKCDKVCKGSNVVASDKGLIESDSQSDNRNVNESGARQGDVPRIDSSEAPVKEGKSSNIQMNMSLVGNQARASSPPADDEYALKDHSDADDSPRGSLSFKKSMQPSINFHSCPVGNARKPEEYGSVDANAFAVAEHLKKMEALQKQQSGNQDGNSISMGNSMGNNINLSSLSITTSDMDAALSADTALRNANTAAFGVTNGNSGSNLGTNLASNTISRKPLSLTNIMGPTSPLLRRLKTRLRGLRELFDELEYFRMQKYEEYLAKIDEINTPIVGPYQDELDMYRMLQKQNQERKQEGKPTMDNPRPTAPKFSDLPKLPQYPFVQPFNFRDFVRLYSFVFSHSHSVKEESSYKYNGGSGVAHQYGGYNGKKGGKADEIEAVADSSSSSSSSPFEAPAVAMIVPYANLINHSVECGDACEKARNDATKANSKEPSSASSVKFNNQPASASSTTTTANQVSNDNVPAELASLLTSTNNQAESEGFDEKFRPTLHAVLRGDEDFFEVWMNPDEKNNLHKNLKPHTHYDEKSKKTYSHSHETEGEVFLKYAKKNWMNKSSYGVSHFFEQFGILDPSLSTTFELQPALTPEFPLFALKSERVFGTAVIENKMRTLRDVDFLEQNAGEEFEEEYADSIFAPELHRAAKRAGDALETATSMMGWAVGTVMRGGWIGKKDLVEGSASMGNKSLQGRGKAGDGKDDRDKKKEENDSDVMANELANLAHFNINAANSLEALGPLCLNDRMWFESSRISSADTAAPVSLPKTLQDWTKTNWKLQKWKSSKYKSTLEFKTFLLIDCHDENLERDRDEARERILGMKEAHKKKSKSAYYKEILPLARFLVSGDEDEECLGGTGGGGGSAGSYEGTSHKESVSKRSPGNSRSSPFCEHALANKIHELSAYRFVERELSRLLRDYPLETSWIEKRELPYVWLREREVQCLSTLRSENRHAFENFVWATGGTVKETLSAAKQANTDAKSKGTGKTKNKPDGGDANFAKTNTAVNTLSGGLASATTIGIASTLTNVANFVSTTIQNPPTVTPPSTDNAQFSHGLASDIRPVRKQEISVSAPGLSDPLNQLWVAVWIMGAGFWAVVQKVVREYREGMRRRKMI